MESEFKLISQLRFFIFLNNYKDIDDLLKDMVKIIEDWLENINNEKYFDKAEKRYYKQILKHIYN